jgi:hypothetical protein
MPDTEVADPLDSMLEDEATLDEEPTEVAEEEAQPEESDQPRDEAGRYAAREDEQPTEEAETPSEPADGEAPQSPEESGVEDSTPRKFSYNADYQPWEIEGSEVRDDGVFFSKEALPQITQLFAAGRHHLGGWQKQRQESQQQVQEAQQSERAQAERANSIIAKFDELMKLDENELYEAVQGFRGQWPTVKAEADKAAIVAKSEQDRQRLAQYEAQEYERQVTPILRQSLANEVVKLRSEKYSNLSEQDVRAVYEHLWNNRANSNVFVAQNNQLYTDTSIVENQLAYAARLKGEQQQQQARTTQAKEKNKAVAGQTTKKPPPHVSTKTGSAPTGKVKERPKFTSTEEVDDWFDEQDFDE